MMIRNYIISLGLISLLFVILISCSDDSDSTDANGNGDDNISNIDRNSLATNGCQNVVIADGFAYAACGNEIEVISLETLERTLLNITGDDITIDSEAGLLFTLDQTTINVLSLQDPMNPNMITTVNTNFSIFSGISAANGVLVVSAGSGNSDTQIYTYTGTSITLTTDGNTTIDGVTGNPDVHVTATDNGIKAFYSQDIGQVANWAIQIADINPNGQVVDTPPSVVLTQRQFTGSFANFSPSNFPVESEFLNDRLYVAHFGVPGIEIIDLVNNNQLLPPINLPYQPTNIATDGISLFIVGRTNNTVDVIDPDTEEITTSITTNLSESTGIAANETHIVVADRNEGLIVIPRD